MSNARPPPKTAIEALSRANWKTLHPRLLQAAAAYLHSHGCVEDDKRRPFTLEPDELLNGAIERFLEPEHWVSGMAETEESLVAVVCGTMRSIASNSHKRAEIAQRSDVDPHEACDQLVDESPSPSRKLAACEHVALIGKVLEDDPEALAVHRELCQEHSEREEIADALGLSAKRVKVVRQRASRRLDAMHITLDNDGEPPESGT